MVKHDYDGQLFERKGGLIEFEAESLVFDVSDALRSVLANSTLTKTDLAQSLGISVSAVSQALGGGRNLTLRSLAKLSYALGQRVHFSICPAEANLAPSEFRYLAPNRGYVISSQKDIYAEDPEDEHNGAANPLAA